MKISPTREINAGVFWPAIAIAGGFVLWGGFAPDSLTIVARAVLNWIIRVFGWSFVISTAFFLAFAVPGIQQVRPHQTGP
jgi:glycine betaine transporter